MKKKSKRPVTSKVRSRATAKATPSFRLAAATPEDMDVWRIMREDMYDGLDEDYHDMEMQAVLASADRACLLVQAPNDEVVGFLEISLRNVVDGCAGTPVGYIEGIYLVPGFRGLGLGSVLIDAAGIWFAKRGCTEMATDTEIDDEEQQAFWSDLGFEETWRTVQYRRPITTAPAEKRKSRR